MHALVYVVDCLRSDHLSCYGYERETTPHIDALAADGLRYEQCFTPSTWTRPASVSLLTGTHPPTHGARHRGDLFPSTLSTLPESLSTAGFESVGISTMGNVSDTIGHDRGFDAFHALYKDEEIVRMRSGTSTTAEKLFHEDRPYIALPRAEDVTERLIPLLDAGDDHFFFCWSIDPHLPFTPPETHRDFLDPEYDGPVDGNFDSLPDDPTPADITHLRDLYDCEIRYVDDEIGRLVDAFKDRDIYDESLFIVVGDHGEAFYEHGTVFHGNAPYEEVLHVPLVLKPPAHIDIGRESMSDVVSLVDLYPTLLEILQIETWPESLQGRVLPPFGEPTGGDPVYSETQLRDFKPAYYSVRTDQWKYIETRRPSLPTALRRLYRARDSISNPQYALATIRNAIQSVLSPTVDRELFDLERDPGETTNLVVEREDVADRLQERLDAWLRECETHADAETTERGGIDAETVEQLKRLGYAE